MDWSVILGDNAKLVLKVLAVLVSVNLVLSFLSAGLNAIKDKTETQVDNKAAAIVGAIATALKTIVDFLSANVKH